MGLKKILGIDQGQQKISNTSFSDALHKTFTAKWVLIPVLSFNAS